MQEILPEFLRTIYPFKPHYLRLRDGQSMHYVDEGFGETVLLLHGHPTWSFFFRNLICLLRSDFKCMAIDHIGYGMSSKPHGYRYEISQHIANVIEFVEAMKFKKFHIIGEDFGVAAALALAEFWPERISSMSLLNSAVFAMPKLSGVVLMFKFPLLGFCMSTFFNLFTRIYMHLGVLSTMDDAIFDGYLWPHRNLLERSAVVAGTDDIPWLSDHHSLDTFERICEKAFLLANKKIEFFWANNDFLYTSNVLEQWKKILPNAFVKHYQSGHLLFEDSPEAMNDVRLFIHGAKDISKDLFRQTVVKPRSVSGK
ncbi:MAG: alpha/beta fold hydrolase [Puniceicoccales bacterium]|jgi:haloalkane dehalogenase|nr:alpha/beta fold hydrolase [Puniceicoccales bacterium]